MTVDEHTIDVAGAPVFYRRASADAIVYLHSIPTSGDDWLEFLALSGGAAPDLPGFGRSGKATGYDYSVPGYVRFLEQFLDAIELSEVTLVAHGWGAAIGLVFAQRHPERIERLAIVDAIPLLDDFQWPAIARWWRRPGTGELLMGSLSRWLLARLLRSGSVAVDAWSEARIDQVWEQFDQGTQRAILRLHRSIGLPDLAAAGRGLPELDRPVLVVWGDQDRWLSPAFADAYGRRLPAATVEHIAGAGHWPWLDRPELITRLAAFAGGGAGTPT